MPSRPAFISPQALAELTGIPEQEITRQCESGDIVAVKISDGWRIPTKQALKLRGEATQAPTFVSNPDKIVH